MTDVLPGHVVERVLGRGGSSVVYLARQELLDRLVAVKVISAPVDDPRVWRDFEREARAVARLSSHPNVVTVFTTGRTADGRPFLVTEYLDGGSLGDLLARSGPLPPAAVAHVGLGVADALAAAHELGIVHRDVKPGNVLLGRRGEVKLADFGIARLAAGTATATTGRAAFTPQHVAPEVLRGEPEGPWTDVYGLASTLVSALTGRSPFERAPGERVETVLTRKLLEPPPSLPAHVPGALAATLTEALASDAAARPSLAAVRATLAGLAEPDATWALQAVALEPPPEPPPGPPPAPAPLPPIPMVPQPAPAPTAMLPSAAATATAVVRPATVPPAMVRTSRPPAPPPPGPGRSSRRGWWVVGGIVVAALLLVAAVVAANRRSSGDATPDTTTASTSVASTTQAPTTPAPPTTLAPTTAPPTTAAPTTPAPTTAAPTTRPPTTVPPTSAAETTASPPDRLNPNQRRRALENRATEYYDTVEQRDYDAAWAMLTPSFQEQTGGFEAYSTFWDGIDGIEVRSVDIVDAGSDDEPAVVRLDMRYRVDDDVTAETDELTMVRDSTGAFLIDGYRVVSARDD